MTYRYAVVGAGRQGTAAAYDFGRFGEAEVIWLADTDAGQAERSAAGSTNSSADRWHAVWRSMRPILIR